MTDYCDFVDCPNEATVVIPDGKNVCYLHATRYQNDIADRFKRTGDSVL